MKNMQYRKKQSLKYLWLLAPVAIMGDISNGYAQQVDTENGQVHYSSKLDHDYPNNVYWGDTHLHTSLSFDANGLGNQSLFPDDAYQFAKGERVVASSGHGAQLLRPLDFLVVADHGANMGVMPALAAADADLLKTREGQYWYKQWEKVKLNAKEILEAKDRSLLDQINQSLFAEGDHGFFWRMLSVNVVIDKPFRTTVWSGVTESADKHNTPGLFTAFSGYEWTANSPAAIHRVVIFKDDAEKVNQILPFTAYDSVEPEQLWQFMEDYEQKTAGEVLAIPHNSNISEGYTFALTNSKGELFDKSYALMRSRWEPLVEVTQVKGDSESHPFLSPYDEFADYETWNSWYGWRPDDGDLEVQKRRKEFEYVRPALKNGLVLQSQLGINPFKVGMIGSTDAHNSLTTADENNFWGKHALSEPSRHRLDVSDKTESLSLTTSWQYAASGYAAVWAEENTREALFAAMKRKEVYATTGPRINVRFFGGWHFSADDAYSPDLAAIGYIRGVPMGGDLSAAPAQESPKFLIRAVKDPDGANLDRVQVIKGWHDANGEPHEKIYNVALSGGRKDLGPKTKKVGNTVDVADASYTNTIGDPELVVVWEDPDFDPNELAFYYLRILEIPTPRWTAYDAKFFKKTTLSKDVPLITQERAYTTPIWYSPSFPVRN